MASRLPGRQPEPHLLVQLRAGGLAAALLAAAGAAALLRALRGQVRPAPAHPLRHRGERGRVGRRAVGLAGRRAAQGRRGGDARGERGDQRRRAALPAEVARDPGARSLQGHFVPLGRVAARARPRRQARARDRHGRQRLPVHPRDRQEGGPGDRLPAHSAVDPAHARVPRRRAGREALAPEPRPVLREVVPLLDVLARGRGHPRPGSEGRQLAGPALGQCRERRDARAAHAVE